MDEMHKQQDPPYSDGLYFVPIRWTFMHYKFSNKYLYGTLCITIFAKMAQRDYLYADPIFTKFSTRRISPEYMTFSEKIAQRYPGYLLNKEGQIVSFNDHAVHIDDLLGLLRSKDISAYEKNKDHFWGFSPRYTTKNSKEQLSIVYATYPRSGNSLMRKYFENCTGTATGSDMVNKFIPNIAL